MKVLSDLPACHEEAAINSNLEHVLQLAAHLAVQMEKIAQQTDEAASFPHQEFSWLAEAGLLEITLPGESLDYEHKSTAHLLQLLKLIGKGNLSVGRIYEGHINALYLIHLFAKQHQKQRWYEALRQSKKIFGVWNTQAQDGVSIVKQPNGSYQLTGAKTFCSGAAWITRPIVPGVLIDEDGKQLGWQMCIVPMEKISQDAIDPSFWKPLGMKSSVSYKIRFEGVEIREDDLLGTPDDYHRQPHFSGGAIRFAAVQLGGAEAIFDATRHYLQELHRTEDPYQQMRLGEMAILIETGNLWLRQAGEQADRHDKETTTINYANMTRTAIEKICIETIRLAERCVGARGLLQPHPFSRLHADLTTYLRQPAPDAALAQVGQYVAQNNNPVHALWSTR